MSQNYNCNLSNKIHQMISISYLGQINKHDGFSCISNGPSIAVFSSN